MRYVALENTLWVAALCGELALGLVACYKGRWKTFPCFTALISFQAVASLLLIWLRRYAPAQYSTAYWSYATLDFALQLALVFELARHVLLPTQDLVRNAWKKFLSYGLLGALGALLLAQVVAPPGQSYLEQIEIRANLFTSLLICELVIVMMMTSSNTGLGWRNHVMAVGEGLLAWSTVAVLADSLHSYFGNSRFYAVPEYSKEIIYLGALGYWCVQLWREEPARKEISPELRKYIVALHQRVHYDLGEMER